MYIPDTAVDGTVHEADTPQLPQSVKFHMSVKSFGLLLEETVRLDLRKCRRGSNGGDEASAIPSIISKPIYIDVVRQGGCINLESDGSALVDADVRRETLDTGITGTADIPLTGRVAGQTILRHDFVWRIKAIGGEGPGRWGLWYRSRQCDIETDDGLEQKG